MKLFTLISTTALMSVAFAADPAATSSTGSSPMKTMTEKALAAKNEALAIDGILKSKSPDMAAAAARAEALDKHVAELQAAAQEAGMDHMKAPVDVLKVLTENKAKQLASADAKARNQYRATAKNIAMRADKIAKAAQKIGG
ncbi:MAG: hypothetical protein JNM66_16360 [Bryobacterales bacterium]|nr:hypothetical protein [Bryobacterales bacterium]